jgi:hypothetical protein
MSSPPAVEVLPLVDCAVLQELEEQLGQSRLARNFADDYAAMWEHSRHRLVNRPEEMATLLRLIAIHGADTVTELQLNSAAAG